MADITLGQFYEAIRQSAREGTLQALKELLEEIDFATNTALNSVRDSIGSLNDAAASAGGTGSVSAKLRRLTADLSVLTGTVDAGAQKVALTGRDATIIADQSVTIAAQFVYIYAGGVSSSNFASRPPIDVRRYRRLGVYIYNNADAQISFNAVAPFVTLQSANDAGFFNYQLITLENATVPVGGRRLVGSVDVPELDLTRYPALGIILRLNTLNITTGEVRVILLGVPN